MQLVQTLMRLGEPFTRARMRWMFGFHRRLVRRCEWLTFLPKEGCLPHTSHTDAMTESPENNRWWDRSTIAAHYVSAPWHPSSGWVLTSSARWWAPSAT